MGYQGGRSSFRRVLMRGGALLGAGTGAGSLLGSELDGLAIDFATDLSMVIRDRTTPSNQFSGDPNSKLTYSSPSTKWILGSNGLYSSGTTIRTEYNSSGTALGVRIEEARTNLCLYSSQFDNAAWTKSDFTVTANNTTSPDGTANADLLTSTVGNNQLFQLITLADSSTYTGSIFVKRSAGNNWCYLLLRDKAGGTNYAWFNIATGAKGTTSGTVTAYTIDASVQGFYRITITCPSATGATAPFIFFGTATGDGAFAGSAGDAVWVWQAQFELGAFATSPIETAGSTVTRAADNLYAATSIFPYSNDFLTFYANVRPSFDAADHVALAYNAGGTFSAGPGYLLRLSSVNGSANANAGGNSTSVSKVLNGGSPLVSTAFTKIAGVGNDVTNEMTVTGSGLTPAATVTTLDWTGTTTDRLQFGALNGSGTQMMNGHIAQMMVLPRYMTDAQLIAVTT